MDDEPFYAQVAAEIESGALRTGLWAKAFSETGGDEATARALYIRLRVDQLIEEVAAAAARVREEAERAELDRNKRERSKERDAWRVEMRKATKGVLWILFVVGVLSMLVLSGARDPILREAVRLAGEAVEADERRDYAVARQRLKSAVGLLLRDGRLDDVPLSEVVDVALARIEEDLGSGVDLAALFARSHARTQPAPAVDTE